MILTAFEGEFYNLYGKDALRSERYINFKNEIIEHLQQYVEGRSKKYRDDMDHICDVISKTDDSYSARVKKTLLDNRNIMEPFIKKQYKGEYNKIVDGISSRIGNLRNEIAHGDISRIKEAVNLSDIKIIEELLYVIRLKEYNSDKKELMKVINDLFCEDFAI